MYTISPSFLRPYSWLVMLCALAFYGCEPEETLTANNFPFAGNTSWHLASVISLEPRDYAQEQSHDWYEHMPACSKDNKFIVSYLDLSALNLDEGTDNCIPDLPVVQGEQILFKKEVSRHTYEMMVALSAKMALYGYVDNAGTSEQWVLESKTKEELVFSVVKIFEDKTFHLTLTFQSN